MIPKIARGGCSFKGAYAYYLHDKGADTAHRVEWVQTENLRTEDPAKAWKVMAFTAKEHERLKEASGQSRAGRKLKKPVLAFSLAWHPEQSPPKEHMIETARKAIAALGLTEHQYVMVSHRDEPQKHVHVVVNRVHPFTGLAGDVRNSKRKLSDFAREYEREHGKIYCQQREDNHRDREAGATTRYCDPHIMQAWATTKTGKSFMAALEAKGYSLAQGRKRPVIVDPHGKCHNPTRHLEGEKAKDLWQRLADVDFDRLPTPEAVIEKRRQHDQRAPSPQEKSAYELLGGRLEALERRQSRERDELAIQHEKRLDFSKSHLAQYYHLKERRDELVILKHKVAQASWWKRLLGFTRKDRKEMAEKARTYNDAVGRYKERILHIKSEGWAKMEALKARHGQERAQLEMLARRALDSRQKDLSATHHPAPAVPDLTNVFTVAAEGDTPENHENSREGRKGRVPPSYKQQKSAAYGNRHRTSNGRENGGRGL